MDEKVIPLHVGFIMDGNGRWANKQNKPRSYGHIKGAENVENVVKWSFLKGIKVVSLYAFSTENWKRSKEEIDKIFSLLELFLTKYLKTLTDNKVRFMVSGDISALPDNLKEKILHAEKETESFNDRILNVAINYGGRQEIVSAVNEILKTGLTEVDEKTFSRYLYTKDLPDVDLVIRTSGERRISNFLIYQSAYAELYFSEKYWPEFDEGELDNALSWYASRNRRFGGV